MRSFNYAQKGQPHSLPLSETIYNSFIVTDTTYMDISLTIFQKAPHFSFKCQLVFIQIPDHISSSASSNMGAAFKTTQFTVGLYLFSMAPGFVYLYDCLNSARFSFEQKASNSRLIPQCDPQSLMKVGFKTSYRNFKNQYFVKALHYFSVSC